jgi:hypothetical protein
METVFFQAKIRLLRLRVRGATERDLEISMAFLNKDAHVGGGGGTSQQT